ncbi:unnamed protein product [Penicillium olsonii]|nr:unnamed protein product [Penicillium olsonii]
MRSSVPLTRSTSPSSPRMESSLPPSRLVTRSTLVETSSFPSRSSFPSPRLLLELPSPSALAVPAVVVAVLPAAVVDSVLVVVPPAVVVDSVPPVAAVASAVVLPVAVVASVVVAVLPVVVVASVVADIRSDDPMYCLLMAFGGYGSFVQEYLFRLLVHPAQLQLKWLQAVEYHQSKNLSVQIFNGSWSFIVVLAINPCSINGCLHKRPQPPVMWLSHRLTAFACSLENDVDRSEFTFYQHYPAPDIGLSMSRRTSAMASSDSSSGVPPSGDGGQEKQKMLLSSDHGHFSMVKLVSAPPVFWAQLTFRRAMHLADLITEMNVMSVFSSMRYCLGEPTEYGAIWAALAFMPFGLFFDFMDGKVARWRKKSSLMGQELDSLADLISFGLAPAAAAFALGIRTTLDHVFLTFFVLCGLTRLARFNVTVAVLPKDKSGKSKYFEGTPIPTTLSIASLMAYWVSQSWTHENIPLGLFAEGTIFEFHPVVLMFVLHGCLMVSKTIHIPKP